VVRNLKKRALINKGKAPYYNHITNQEEMFIKGFRAAFKAVINTKL
jgi:hypothetical protein